MELIVVYSPYYGVIGRICIISRIVQPVFGNSQPQTVEKCFIEGVRSIQMAPTLGLTSINGTYSGLFGALGVYGFGA